ncbi:MAG: nitrilase [Desulfobacteraceae bacterium]|nr:nitrilase [Desulfobacteraceae bacterium]MBC2757922.1 nitrilase [Desulfobacteraceae bacterium]
MRVAIHQMSPVLLDLKANLEEVIEKINQSKEKGVQLNVFPELALTGYFVGPRYHEVSLRLDSKEIQSLKDATKGTGAIVGFIEESPSMNFYNSALVAIDGEILFAYRKLNLPNYGVFEERKCFANGKQVKVFQHCGLNVAVFICNDLWHPSIPYLAVCQKADVFITIINSTEEAMAPEFSNMESWEIINKSYSRIYGIFNICANRVGKEKAKDWGNYIEKTTDVEFSYDLFCHMEEGPVFEFWGGSEIINPYGQQVYKAAYYEPDEIFGEIDRNVLRQKKILLPYLRNDDPFFTHRELTRVLFDKEKNIN